MFELFFPTTKKTLPEQLNKVPLEYLRGNRETVMLIDDEELLLDVAQKMLENLDYQVVTMNSGEAAVTHLRSHYVDLIVLDMIMDPGISGQQTYEEILRFRPEQRAIIASGFAKNEDVNQVLNKGASSFVRKPYTMMTLGIAIKEALKTEPV